MVRPHQPVFDADLTRDQVDEAAVDEVRRHADRPLFGEQQAFALDPRQAAYPRTDRTAGAQLHVIVHVGQARILERLAGGVDAIDDAWIDLAFHLVIATLAGLQDTFGHGETPPAEGVA